MPTINGRYYANPAYGREVERARQREQVGGTGPALGTGNGADVEPDGHWVTIEHRHVLIRDNQAGNAQQHIAQKPHKLSPRDEAYLDKYYDAVLRFAKAYDVDPTLVLGLGIESGFASAGTYLRTGDAFGMTGGSTGHMTTAASPAENVKQFFDRYGDQVRGTGSDPNAFINALEGRNALGRPEPGWRVYNSVQMDWPEVIRSGIAQMRRDIPGYVSGRTSRTGH